ncbi:MAG TPA: hypothetical protein VGI16_02095 [Candidatus Acidoferrum sp.]
MGLNHETRACGDGFNYSAGLIGPGVGETILIAEIPGAVVTFHAPRPSNLRMGWFVRVGGWPVGYSASIRDGFAAGRLARKAFD